MRKITENAISNFYAGKIYKNNNTKVEVLPNVTILKLHNNPIAYLYNDPKRTLSITNAGWFSNTTKERLNGLQGVNIYQKNFVWFLNDKEWNGKLIDVKY